MALGDLFKLTKLTIQAFSDEKRKSPAGRNHEFEVMFNPSSLKMQYTSQFQEQEVLGSSSSQARYSRSRANALSIKLIIDGTGVSSYGLSNAYDLGYDDVATQVDRFLGLCYRMNGDIHEPNFLRLIWGKGPLGSGFDCRLRSVDINYTSFNRDGSPLRAELAATFVEHLDADKLANQERTSSPDLTHTRTVKHGDTLPLLCREIYGSAEYYLRVAQANELDDFRNLTPGQELGFPPFDRD